MEKAKLMQLEIEKKRRLPRNIKKEIRKRIFQDLVVAAIIMAYFCIVNFLYYNFEGDKFEEYLKYFALSISVATVISIEVAYRKESVNLLVIGIELLLCGILSLYIPYIFLHTTSAFRISIMLLPAFLIIYYGIKSVVIYKKRQFDYRNNLSDVREILVDEKKSYLEEESGKTYRDKVNREKVLRQKILEEQAEKRKGKTM